MTEENTEQPESAEQSVEESVNAPVEQQQGPEAEGNETQVLPAELDFEPTMESVIEAVLFASDEPLPASRLANITETSAKQVKEHIKELNRKYSENNSDGHNIHPATSIAVLMCIGIQKVTIKQKP